jgi:hypothetical protein
MISKRRWKPFREAFCFMHNTIARNLIKFQSSSITLFSHQEWCSYRHGLAAAAAALCLTHCTGLAEKVAACKISTRHRRFSNQSWNNTMLMLESKSYKKTTGNIYLTPLKMVFMRPTMSTSSMTIFNAIVLLLLESSTRSSGMCNGSSGSKLWDGIPETRVTLFWDWKVRFGVKCK